MGSFAVGAVSFAWNGFREGGREVGREKSGRAARAKTRETKERCVGMGVGGVVRDG